MSETPSDKLSPGLAALAAGVRVRAVLMLERPPVASGGRRAQRAERRRRADAVRRAGRAALPAIDAALAAGDGQRLGEPTLLGSIPVEATAETLRSLAALPQIRAILEDLDLQSPPSPPGPSPKGRGESD